MTAPCLHGETGDACELCAGRIAVALALGLPDLAAPFAGPGERCGSCGLGIAAIERVGLTDTGDLTHETCAR